MKSDDGFFVVMIMLVSLFAFWMPDNSNERQAAEKPEMRELARTIIPARQPEGLETRAAAKPVRLEDHTLLPGEGDHVLLPSMEYVESIRTKVCSGVNELARNDCERRISEVQNGYRDITSRINPPYGRPPLTDPQLQ